MIVNFKLQDTNSEDFPETLEGVVGFERDNLALLVGIKGYGCQPDLNGYPILLEKHEGRLRLLVWSDINQEDPTHIIDLEDARESNREGD